MNRLLEMAEDRWAHASGALWLPSARALIIADAHLGYGWAQRRRGEMGPVSDGSIGKRLLAVVDELSPRTVVFLGDVVHAPRPVAEERRLITEVFEQLAAKASLLIVRGNHDRGFVRDFGALGYGVASEWRSEGLIAVHGDRLVDASDEHLVVGHFHPVLLPRDAAGAKTRVPVFAWSERATILPAFSPFAAGCDLVRGWSTQLQLVLGPGAVHVAACTGRRIVALPFRRPDS